MGGVFAVQMALSQMAPTIDETSGVFAYAANGAVDLAMQISVVAILRKRDGSSCIIQRGCSS